MTVEEYINKMTPEEKTMLLQGATNWTTCRLGRMLLPDMFLADGPHGLRKQAGASDHLGVNRSVPATCFPTAATMANSWDPELGEQLGIALGEEAAAQGVHVVLGPGLNIKRSPLCGRNFEYFSEDPYLSGKMAAAYIRGIQKNGVAACPKHFAANSQENLRMSTDSVVDERTLRELYLTGFEIAVKEGKPKAIMSGYNKVCGTYANENPYLLKQVLREEWGFGGFVVSDWGGCNDPVAAIAAGSALNMPSPGLDNARTVYDGVRSGRITEEDLDARLRELLPVILEAQNIPKTEFRDHHLLAKKCAAESIVLLENDGILPLAPQAQVAVIGDFAKTPRYQGSGSSLVNPTKLDNLLDALKETDLRVTFAQGYRRGKPSERPLVREAINISKTADVVLLCVGLEEGSDCEGRDRKDMSIPEAQLELISEIAAVNPNTVLVLSGGAPFVVPRGHRAVIHGYLGGQAGASAMADALTGKVCPSGKLAESWPERVEDTPCYGVYPATGPVAAYQEGLYVGYRYYQTADVAVRYPFGHGLSYTKFDYSHLQCDSRKVTFTLTNLGDCDGAEVVQVYIGTKTGKLFRPRRELKGFQKVWLKAGESRQVTVELDDKAFRYFNTETGSWEMETSHYVIEVGASVTDIRLSATLRLIGTDAPLPTLYLPGYASGRVQELEPWEFETLLGRKLGKNEWSEDLQLNDPILRFRNARTGMARFLCRRLEKRVEKRGITTDMTEIFILNMPIRALAQMTGGKISRAMTENVVYWANGHFWGGLWRLIKGFFKARKLDRAYRKELDYGPRDSEV